jgi:hypothetical protein
LGEEISVSPLLSLQVQMSSAKGKRIIRYDRKLIRIVQKVKEMSDELIKRLYRSEHVFEAVDERYQKRIQNNLVLVENFEL